MGRETEDGRRAEGGRGGRHRERAGTEIRQGEQRDRLCWKVREEGPREAKEKHNKRQPARGGRNKDPPPHADTLSGRFVLCWFL